MEDYEQGSRRNLEIDLVKGIAIISMVLIESNMLFAEPGDENWIFNLFRGTMAGTFCAFTLMIAMGYGWVSTCHQRPADFVRRGISLFIVAIALNMIRYSMPYLITQSQNLPDFRLGWGSVISAGHSITNDFLYLSFAPDILQFAALATILYGDLRSLRCSNRLIFRIAAVLSLLLTVIRGIKSGILIVDFIASYSLFNPNGRFPLLGWFIFPAFGAYLADLQSRYDQRELYHELLLIAVPESLAYIFFTIRFESYFPFSIGAEFGVTFLDCCGIIALNIVWIYLWCMITQICPRAFFRHLRRLSMNVTSVYIFSCIMIMWGSQILMRVVLGIESVSLLSSSMIGIIILLASLELSRVRIRRIVSLPFYLKVYRRHLDC